MDDADESKGIGLPSSGELSFSFRFRCRLVEGRGKGRKVELGQAPVDCRPSLHFGLHQPPCNQWYYQW